MSEINVQDQIKETIEINSQPKKIENTTLIDDLLDEKSFTSIENLKIDNEDTIINSSYITGGEDKKSNFLDLINQNNNNNNNKNDNNNDNDTDSQLTVAVAKESSNTNEEHSKILNIDDAEVEEVDELVNNKLLKRIESNDSLELKRHKSLTKLELENILPLINNQENSLAKKNNEISITLELPDGSKSNLNDSIEFSSKKSSFDSLSSLGSNINNSNNNLNINDSAIHNSINTNIFSDTVYSNEFKTHIKDNSSLSYSSAKEGKALDDPVSLDLMFDKKKNSSTKYNTIAKCSSLQFEKDNINNNNNKLGSSESTGLVLKSSLKKISMFSSDYSNLPRKQYHVQILDSVIIINPREEDKRMSFKKGFRAIRKSLSSNSVKNLGKGGDKNDKKESQTSKLGVIITTDCLNDVEKENAPKQEDNHLSVNSKVDKIINHCRKLSFSKMGKSGSNENNSKSSGSKNDYRKDIEKMRKKYALVEEKPKSKYYALKKMLDITSSDEEFLALSSLEVYYKNINALPNEIGDMVNLRFLYLNDNKITSIPPDIGKLINLIHLDLSFNILSSIPKEIGNLKNLKKLILNGNKLVEVPEEIGTLTELKILQLHNNQLTDIPKSIVNLEFLVELNISKNKIKKLPDIFDDMKKRCKIKL